MITREAAKELLPIIQAFAEGKPIQDKIEGMTDWVDTDEINLEYEGDDGLVLGTGFEIYDVGETEAPSLEDYE